MLESGFANQFAYEWESAWNRHDLDSALSHYTEGFQFSSPIISAVAGEASGILVGHKAMRAYWRKALERRPDLAFKVIKVLIGVNSLIIYYSRHDNKIGAEYFEFNKDRKVFRSSAHYAEH